MTENNKMGCYIVTSQHSEASVMELQTLGATNVKDIGNEWLKSNTRLRVFYIIVPSIGLLSMISIRGYTIQLIGYVVEN